MELDQIRTDLTKASILCFSGSGIVSTLIGVMIVQNENLNFHSMIIGGTIGFASVFLNPGRPKMAGRRFNIPSKLSGDERELHIIILSRRKRFWIVLSVISYFLWLLYKLITKSDISNNQFIFDLGSMFISFLFVNLTGSGVQYLQVLTTLKRKGNQFIKGDSEEEILDR